MSFEGHPRFLERNFGDPELLENWIFDGEHQRQDFKFRIDSSIKIAATIAAFANTDGGRILIGVKDNGKIAGIDPEEEYYMIEGAADLYCAPPVSFKSIVFEVEEKLVLCIEIAPSIDRPHFVKEGALKSCYMRQRDENFRVNRALIRYLKDKTPKSKAPNLIAYSQTERQLFDYLSKNEFISISKFSRLAKIPLGKAERILASFIKWNLIEWFGSEKGVRFRLKPDSA